MTEQWSDDRKVWVTGSLPYHPFRAALYVRTARWYTAPDWVEMEIWMATVAEIAKLAGEPPPTRIQVNDLGTAIRWG